jgi:RND family efflux transporter MFP subunit
MSLTGESASLRTLWRSVRSRPPWRLLAALVVLPVGLGWFWTQDKAVMSERPVAPLSEPPDGAIPRVDVVRPRVGGIPRMTVQPGSVHAFESVDLYAMVSGYLRTQAVDIGSHVKKGQVLASIDVPREAQAVAEASSLLEQAKAQARQAVARVRCAEADRETAAATLAQVEADVDRLVANRELAEKQYVRIKALADRLAIEPKLVDEQQHDLDAALVAERTARLAVRTARARLSGAAAALDQAKADQAVADESVGVAEARLAKARVDVDYSRITAPFDGVVTHRQFHPGAFIRASADGNQPPLLTVVRTDLMRVVVRIPDRDAVLADPGDPAELTIDALDGRTFHGAIARVAESEDHQSRTMRVEIDLPNPDGVLREGMYGRAAIRLAAAERRLALPAECVLDRAGKGKGSVRLVRQGRVYRAAVKLGADDGGSVEVVSGLGPDDRVVVRSSTPLEDGMPVVVEDRG